MKANINNIHMIKWDKKFVMSTAGQGLILRLYKKFGKNDKNGNPFRKMSKAFKKQASKRLTSI